MKYWTLENSGQVSLRRERRSGEQLNKLPLEDLNGKIVVKERRASPDRRTEGVEVTETNLSQDEFKNTSKIIITRISCAWRIRSDALIQARS